MPNKQASPSVISGRELRRARNALKRYSRDVPHGKSIPGGGAITLSTMERWRLKEVWAARRERACALILAAKLAES